VVFPQTTTLGFCFEFASLAAPPALLWQRDYAGRYLAYFGPFVVLAEMTNRGKPDILLAGKPACLHVIDIDTGEVCFGLQYPVEGGPGIGRPYGLLQAVDIDGDGFRDAVMASCQVEEYIGILRNEGGRAFSLAWSRFIEQDLPDDDRELRPTVTSLADVNGDGRQEFVVGLYSAAGDKRWHTVVFDAFGGWQARLADLPDRCLWGCYDLDGDGRPEIITSSETERRCGTSAALQAVDGRSFGDLAVVERAILATAAAPLPRDTLLQAARQTPLCLALPKGHRGLLLRREGIDAGEVVWRLANGVSVFEPAALSPLARSLRASGRDERIPEPEVAIREPAAPPTPAASGPLVSFGDGQRELILACGDGTVIGGPPDLSRPGRFHSLWSVAGTMPSVWLGPQGERVVCVLDPSADAAWLYTPVAGNPAPPAGTRLALPLPPYRVPGALIPFGASALRVFVGLRTGAHTLACALFDAQGRQLWQDAKEGPYPRVAAVADLGGDGRPTMVVDNHGKHILFDEHGGKRVVAHGWYETIPDRSDGAKYALPIVGPFGPGGETRIVMSPGLDALEVLDPAGARLVRVPYGSTYEREWCDAAVAQVRGDGTWDLGMLTHAGTLHCTDLQTGRSRWTVDLEVPSTQPTRTVSGDLEGDGRDEFLVGLVSGDLVAVREEDGRGTVLWRTALDGAIRDTVVADVDGDGRAEIIVETDDGLVRILAPARAAEAER
jgi:hypothetical protein